jgi:chromosome segregation ATPase
MIGDGGKRKRAAKSAAAKPTAQEALAEAERRLQEARQHLATLRHHARLAHHDQAELQQQVESELRRAGLELRPPNGVEQLQNEANQKGWELHQFQQRIAGAGPAVVQAEERRDTALLATYPQRAAELDRAEEKLVSRRERLEREQAELEQLENDHRAAWRKYSASSLADSLRRSCHASSSRRDTARASCFPRRSARRGGQSSTRA